MQHRTPHLRFNGERGVDDKRTKGSFVRISMKKHGGGGGDKSEQH